jgi:DNA-binding NarL/FixJ family response regulator
MAADLHLARTLDQTGLDPSARLPIRVILADDHAFVRRSLRLLLEGEEGIDVIAEAADLTSAVRDVYSHQPHVLVLDLGLFNGANTKAIEQLRERAPETQIVVLAMRDGPVFARHTLAAGARCFVAKELADGELPQAIRAAARGDEYVSPGVAARLDAPRRSLPDDR